MCIVHKKNNWNFFIEYKIYLFRKMNAIHLKKNKNVCGYKWTNGLENKFKNRNQWITWIMIVGKVLKLIMSIKWTIVQSHVYWNIEFNLCLKCSWKLEVISWKIVTMRKTNKWNKKYGFFSMLNVLHEANFTHYIEYLHWTKLNPQKIL